MLFSTKQVVDKRGIPASFFHFQEVQTATVHVPVSAGQRTASSTQQFYTAHSH